MPRGGHNKLTRVDLRTDIESLAAELGETPTLGQYRERGDYSAGAVYNEFGSWNDALEVCELEINAEFSKEPVVVECASCDAEVEKQPSEVENTQFNYCSQDCHYEHKQERYSGDGNPRSTLVDVECGNCGETLQRPRWKRENNNRHFCDYACMGQWREGNIEGERHPSWKEYPTQECEHCGKSYTVTPALAKTQRFCSRQCKYQARDYSGKNNPQWSGGGVELSCQYCGDKYVVKQAEASDSKYCSYDCMHQDAHPTGEDHPRYKDDKTIYYGPNWPQQRLKAVIRDQARCQEDGCDLTEIDEVSLSGKGLSVHHKKPREQFWENGEFDHEQANNLDNLITLCKRHHRKRHG